MKSTLRYKISLLYLLLAIFTIAAYGALASLSSAFPILFGLGVLAYVLGLRHGVDADHIVAIDNTTRKLMHEGKTPISNGLFFSLGHSTVVLVLVVLVALVSQSLFHYFYGSHNLLNDIGTIISAGFLYIIALMNLFIFAESVKKLKTKGKDSKDENGAMPGGLMSRLFSKVFKSIHSEWQLYFIGLLFGLGFDTATEVTLIGVSATQASSIPLLYILVLPLLFAAGMTLVDSTDSVFMVKAYGWSLEDSRRRITYNLVITAISVLVAIAIATIEVMQLLPVAPLLRNLNIATVGFAIVLLFVTLWTLSVLASKRRSHRK